MSVATMSTEDHVVFIQVSTHTGSDGLLANVRVTRTVNQTTLV
jgi:hypothetical protein